MMRVYTFLKPTNEGFALMIFSSQRNLETVCGAEGTPEDL